MPRIPYKTDAEAGPAAVVTAIRKRRGGWLGNLDRVLLYSEPVAVGWGEFMGRVRRDLTLPPMLRELAMCAVAALNGAEYEMHHHGPIYLAEGGTASQLAALRRLHDDPAALDQEPQFDATERAVLRLTVQSTRAVKIDDATFEEARQALGDDRQLFELVTVIAAYNMVSRVLVAFDIQPEP